MVITGMPLHHRTGCSELTIRVNSDDKKQQQLPQDSSVSYWKSFDNYDFPT